MGIFNRQAPKGNVASSRREFIKTAGFGAALALPVAGAIVGQFFGFGARAADGGPKAPTSKGEPGGAKPDIPMVKPTDANAMALGYVEDATKTDVKKYPKRGGPDGKTQFCYNCAFFQAKTKDAKAEGAAPCTIFAGKGVKSNGWCNSWAKKA